MPLPVYGRLPTSAVQIGIWFSGPFESYIHLARLAYSSVVPRASAPNCTSSAICTAKVTKDSTSSGARKISRSAFSFWAVFGIIVQHKKAFDAFLAFEKHSSIATALQRHHFVERFQKTAGVRLVVFPCCVLASFMTAELCFLKEQGLLSLSRLSFI